MPPTSFLDTPSSLPNFAQIILPPGMTLPQFVSLQDSFGMSSFASIVDIDEFSYTSFTQSRPSLPLQ